MLHVETQGLDGALTCRLEGRFTAREIKIVRTLVTAATQTEISCRFYRFDIYDAIGKNFLLF